MPGKRLTHARVTQHLDKLVALSRRDLGTLCAVIDAPLTPGIPNKKNAISSHRGGVSVPPHPPELPAQDAQALQGESVLRTGLLMQNLIQWPH